MVEQDRRHWEKLSKVKQYCFNLVATQKIILSTFLMPLTFIATCILLYPLCKMLGIQEDWIWVFLGLLILEIGYAPLCVKSWDWLTSNWKHFKYLNLKLFNQPVYRQF
jgi:cellulose synthase/poly-beta-1,6-N-acetylglucosamine synthase-like glycosyltransferase